MRVVLYTRDMEPVTIIEMPVWLLDQLEKVGMVKVAVRDPTTEFPFAKATHPSGMQTLDIYCEKLRWRDGTLKPILVVGDDELALAIKPDWLPGQVQAVQWYENIIRQLMSELEKKFKKKDLDP